MPLLHYLYDAIMKHDEEPGDSENFTFTPVRFKVNSSIQHLQSDLMQHWFVKTYMRQIKDVCAPPAKKIQ